jgi:ribosomal-protein-alanine N-acetyltransferase
VDGERFAGYVDFWVVPPDIELLNIAVDPDYRRRGLGRMLLDVVERRGRERGGEQVFLEVRRSNLGAQRLYEAAGFSQCGIRKGYYSDNGEDAILLTRNLP